MGKHLNVDRCSLFRFDMEAGLARYVAEYSAPGFLRRAQLRPLSIYRCHRRYTPARALTFDDPASDERISELQSCPARARYPLSDVCGGQVGEEILRFCYFHYPQRAALVRRGHRAGTRRR